MNIIFRKNSPIISIPKKCVRKAYKILGDLHLLGIFKMYLWVWNGYFEQTRAFDSIMREIYL